MDMQMGHGLPGRGTVIDANVVGIGPKFGVQVPAVTTRSGGAILRRPSCLHSPRPGWRTGLPMPSNMSDPRRSRQRSQRPVLAQWSIGRRGATHTDFTRTLTRTRLKTPNEAMCASVATQPGIRHLRVAGLRRTFGWVRTRRLAIDFAGLGTGAITRSQGATSPLRRSARKSIINRSSCG